MGKEATIIPSHTSRLRGIRTTARTFILILPFLWLGFHIFDIRIFPSNASESGLASGSGFGWDQITPTEHLEYTPCFDKFQCARLDVPLDYNSTRSDGARVAIAIVRLPASVHVTDPRYGGIILTNPGGPGGSGVKQALRSAGKFAAIINWSSSDIYESDRKHFDIVSFDPRGVNNTTPNLECFPSTSAFDIWRYQVESEGIGSSTAISNIWARAKALSGSCTHDNEISHHMNTPPVVADMVQIIERHAEWRSKEAKSWLESPDGKLTVAGLSSDNSYSESSILERTRWRKGEEKLQYWGFSYGTLLGATFAALQPHRVGRVILDGAEESTDYYSTAWALNLKDTDAIIDKFHEYCAAAGPDKCAFNPGTTNALEIKNQFESLISEIGEDPIAVPGTSTRGPEIITYSDVMQMIRYALYTPLTEFSQVSDLLTDLRGNGSAFADFKQEGHKPSCPLESCKESEPSEPCHPAPAKAASPAILCSDGADLADQTKEGFEDYVTYLYNQSRWLGDAWATISVDCYHWKAKAAWKVKPEDIKGHTSHPILWIGNTLDPVTPLSNAYIMAKKFPGSVVLEQESEGHCSSSSPSLCTAKYIREYFQTGKLPEPGVVCQVQERPLIGNVTELQTLSTEDEMLLEAMRGIGEGRHIGLPLGW